MIQVIATVRKAEHTGMQFGTKSIYAAISVVAMMIGQSHGGASNALPGSECA